MKSQKNDCLLIGMQRGLTPENFHRFLQSAEIVQALSRQIITGKQNRTIIVVLAPLVAIPIELEKLFVVIKHELPNRQQLEQIARGVATETGELTEGRVDRAAPGLGKRALPLGRSDGALPAHRQYLEPPPRQPRAVGELSL